MSKTELTFVGIDDWHRPVFRDPDGNLCKDVTLGSGHPALYSVANNDFDGEPNIPCHYKNVEIKY